MGMDRTALIEFFQSIGEPPFRAIQVLKWIHQQGVIDFDQMTNLSKSLRERLKSVCTITVPQCMTKQLATDGTTKWLLDVGVGNGIEAVLIPETTRNTVCISSQVGCSLNCTFCSTGKQGFNRDLTAAEIIGQLWHVVHTGDKQVTNVVMMGMGEPLLNFEPVLAALRLMRDDCAYGLSKRKVTVSTSGLVPKIQVLRESVDVALAISLHAPNNELRDVLVPLNKKYPIEELLAACKAYVGDDPRLHVTIEYVMLAGVNDSVTHARQLITILQGLRSKVNLIPFNPFPNTEYQCSDRDTIERFQHKLMQAGLIATIRKTRGQDIAAACGQLAGLVKDKTKRSLYVQRKMIPITLNTESKLN